MNRLISTQDAARFLGITRPTVIKYIQEERLKAMRVGKAYKISREEFVRFARSTGMPEKRLADLDGFLAKNNKRTHWLEGAPPRGELVLNDPPVALARESDVLYFLSIRLEGSPSEVIFQVTAPKFFIGRHSLASLSIQDPYVSSIHASLLYQDRFVHVLDQSTNGTLVGGQLLKSGESHRLGDGDQLKVGTTVLSVISSARVDLYLSGNGSNE